MITINDLPVEIITIIFEHLTPNERQKASLVNKYWYHVWASTVFDRDRTLKFDNCVIKSGTDPATIFKGTHRRYNSLILENVDLQDTFLEMWSRIGDYIRYLEFGRAFVFNKQKHFDFLKHFPDLTTLKINFNYWREETYFFTVMPTKVEKLILTFGPYHGTIKAFEKIVCKIRLIKELELENIELSDEFAEYLPKVASVLRKLSIRIYSDQIRNIRKLYGPHVTHLSLRLYGSEINNILPVILYGFPRLQHFKLETRDVLPCRNYNKMEYLKVTNLEFMPDSMRYLIEYKELKTLNISLWEQSNGDCFFGHKIYFNPSITAVTFCTHKIIICEKCIETFIRSLPNLEVFEIDLHLKEIHVELIKNELPHLTCLKYNDYVT